MRVVVFFISFCFFLLGYGHSFSFSMKDESSAVGNAYVAPENTLQQLKTTEQREAVITDYTDIELEEDCYSKDENCDIDKKTVFFKSNFLNNWYLSFFNSILPQSYNANFSTSFCLPRSPIYIKNKVLRI